MGKTKKANRTKGNMRPSNSEHSAQLLTLSGKSFSGFIGFDSLEKDVATYIPVTGQHSSDTSDLSVDSDLRMVMRKMLKRDSITRLKAVQEFGDLCAEKEKEIVKNVLPFWPRLFNKLALDTDRRVREATHQANGKLVTNVKRDIAPYLKNIMGVWLLGQNDIHAPAATTAQMTFAETFPKAKQAEALMYCKNEIFAYFKDNIFEQTAKTMSEAGSISAEDVENKYILVISSTLQALKLFLVLTSRSDISNVHDEYLAIISDNKFWKFAKSKEPQIRGSWYALISVLCKMTPNLFAKMEKKLVTAVFSSLSESDPLVAPSVWDSSLHIVFNFENCWEGINIPKMVLPQIWTLLNGAAKGNAHILYPCILPFLSKFPREVISKDTFSLQFFTCLRNSLSLDSVKLSPMECDAVLTTFIECLLYISFNVLDNPMEGSELLEKVLSDHVLPLLDTSFFDINFSHLATSKFYSLLGSLIQKLENKCLNGDEVEKVFSHTVNLFWNNLYNIFLKFFDKNDGEKIKMSVYINFFFHSIFSLLPSSVKSQKHKVRFEDEVENEDEDSMQTSESLPSVELYKKMPITFTQMIKFIKLLCSKTDESINLCYLKILDEILTDTLNSEFLNDILKSYEESQISSEKSSLIFFNEVILKWISKGEINSSTVTYISDIVFSLFSSVTEDEASGILNACCKVKNPIFLESILTRAFGFSQESVIDMWLRSSSLVEYIVNGLIESMETLKKDDVRGDLKASSHQNMFRMYISNRELQDELNANENIEKLVHACKKLLESYLNSENIDHIVEFGCSVLEEIVRNSKICWRYDITHDLLSLLFHWNLFSEKYNLTEESCQMLINVWRCALIPSYLSHPIEKRGLFVRTAAKELNSCLICLDSTKRVSKVLYEILNFLHLLEKAQSAVPAHHIPILVLYELLESILPSDDQWKTLREGLSFSTIPSFLERKIMYPTPEKENCLVSLESVNKLFLAAKVIAQVFTHEFEKYESFENEQYFERQVEKHIPYLFWSLSYCSGNGYMDKDCETKLDWCMLEKYCQRILDFLSIEVLKKIFDDIYKRSMDEGLCWSLPLNLFMENSKQLYPELIDFFTDLISEVILMDGSYASVTVQVLSRHMKMDKKICFLENLLKDLAENDNFNKDYLRKFGEACCFLQGCREFEDELKKVISKFFNAVMTGDCPKDLEFPLSLQVVSFISYIVQCSPDLITKDIWDYLQLNLSQNIKIGSSVEFDKPEDIVLLFQISLLYAASFYIIDVTKGFKMSWTPTVSEELTEGFISLFVHIGVVIKRFNALPKAFESALDALLKASENIPGNALLNYVIKSPAEICDNRTEKLLNPIDSLLSILLSDIQHLQVAAHSMLMKIMPLLSETVSGISKSEPEDNEDDEEKVPSKLLPLVDTLKLLNELMAGMLWDFKIGECCIVMPNTEPYTFVSAYFFAWLHMLEFISRSPSQVRSGCVAHLEEEKLLSSLFSNLCRLMPENPMACFKKNSDTPKKENLVSLFLHPPVISAGNPSAVEIQTIACYTFCTAIRKVPASVRTWWNNLDKNSADIVNKFTFKYISGILCTEEIQAVYNNENLFKNMVVKARPGSREVIATYTVDDFAIELCVKLPANYPLGPITAEKQGKIIIAQQECRHWLMQLTTVLNYQNGSILDGLNLWKKNLDKKFEGVEECMICYYILHSSSLRLPRVSCPTCKKKFHSNCLYKWFRSINNTKCPLCRNEFTI